MGVNYCSYRYKRKYQTEAYVKRWSAICRRPGEQITDKAFIRNVIIHGHPDASMAEVFGLDPFPGATVRYFRPEKVREDGSDGRLHDACLRCGDRELRFRRVEVFHYEFDTMLPFYYFHRLFVEHASIDDLVTETVPVLGVQGSNTDRIRNYVESVSRKFTRLEESDAAEL
jgi:hypothetical protein